MSAALLASLSSTRRDLLTALMLRGASSLADLAGHAGLSYESTRQHLRTLEREGWINHQTRRHEGGSGRPVGLYSLSQAGEHLFPRIRNTKPIFSGIGASCQRGSTS